MTKELIEIAKENGADIYLAQKGDDVYPCGVYLSTDQLRATIEQVCAPLVSSLTELKSLCWRQTDFNDDGDGLTLHRAERAIYEHRAIIGDKS